jgi:hypothetical protein
MQRRAGTTVVTTRSAGFANDLRRVVMTENGRKEPRNAAGMVLSLQARVGRHREQAARFRRLAEGEEDATFRDKWANLARECASLGQEVAETDEPLGARKAQGVRLTLDRYP